jgi:YfiH family protein
VRPQPDRSFAWIDTAAGPALVCTPLRRIAPHLFTTRRWTLGVPALDDAARTAAWQQLGDALGAPRRRLVRLHQVHGADVIVTRRGAPDHPSALPEADIVLTDDPATIVAVQAADCVPMLFADRRRGAVAAAHAGWRGLAAQVPSASVRAMRDSFGSAPDDLIVAVGPSISAPRYEVGAEVRARFAANGFSDERLARWFPQSTRPEHWQFDGWQSARDQLVDAGVPPEQIHLSGLCTATHAEWLCSYRRDGARAGRIAGAIRMRDAD